MKSPASNYAKEKKRQCQEHLDPSVALKVLVQVEKEAKEEQEPKKEKVRKEKVRMVLGPHVHLQDQPPQDHQVLH
jgi:hypothetical protein